uniref:Uncharacterized protein n=1 Tax=Oncorhynchus mykiss TaxID=8022 RepID=A0A8K9XDT0_ONCMY
MLTLSETVLFLPLWTRNVLPFWKRFVQAWDDLVAVAQRLIDHKLAQMDAQVLAGKQVEGMYLTYLLSCDKLTLEEVYISITELLLGGVDTTSNTLSWALYQLARDAASQDRLYREIMSVCPGRQQPRSEDLSRMPYLKAVIKETLRMYPVVPGNGRLTVDNEVVVDNYWFPKKVGAGDCCWISSIICGDLLMVNPQKQSKCGNRCDEPHFYEWGHILFLLSQLAWDVIET